MRIVDESVQMVHISPSESLTPNTINQVLHRARLGYTYARFYTDKVFIQVNYMRDGTISVSSNIRNPAFLIDYKRNESYGWTESRVKYFVYQWMSHYRKKNLLY